MSFFFKRKTIEESHATATKSRKPLGAISDVRTKALITSVISLLVIFAVAAGFNSYLDQMFFKESSGHLATTYKQVAGTFKLFAHRNWSLLDDWEDGLEYVSEPMDLDATMKYYKEIQGTWGYSEFYLFNEGDNYLTASGRVGTADSISDTFTEMYKKKGPTVSSYIASSGKRKIVFAQPLKRTVEADGISYTGIAISYDNSYVENLVTSAISNETSDCYVVHKNGDVAFSLQNKSVFTEFVSNVPNYLEDNAEFAIGSVSQLRRAIRNESKVRTLATYRGSSYYVVSQSADILDLSIVCIVKASETDSALYHVRNATTLMLILLSVVPFCGVGAILFSRYRDRLTRESQERQEALHKQDMTLQLLHGMAETADRYTVVDLVSETYEYHEHLLDHNIYEESGDYASLLKEMSARYTALTDDDNAKLDRLISIESLREHLRSSSDRIKFEYASRSEAIYMLMTVVPIEFGEDGELVRVILIGQDIGLRKELESAANTDNLTGIFNERYFNKILGIKEFRRIPFTLFYLDLDRFKPVNDTYGHEMGDRVLKQVGARMQACVRANDFAFRIGGDEFALIVTGGMKDADCERMKERVEEQIRAPYDIDGLEVTIGVSCGYASWPEDSPSIAGVRVLADSRMYEDKSAHHAEYGEVR